MIVGIKTAENNTKVGESIPMFALSASRANDFIQCPLMYRLRAIDKIPEPVTLAQVIGTAVHYALENLFTLAHSDRTLTNAVEFARKSWQNDVIDADESVIFAFEERDFTQVESRISELVQHYFNLENPQNFDPFAREEFIEITSGNALLRGYIDRIDRSPDGRIRIVDYKTGKSPRPGYENKVQYQLKFYAALFLLEHGVLPARLRLIFLGDTQFFEFSPDLAEIESFIKKIEILWNRICSLRKLGKFEPQKSALCKWCSFQSYCPLFGGVPPKYPGSSI